MDLQSAAAQRLTSPRKAAAFAIGAAAVTAGVRLHCRCCSGRHRCTTGLWGCRPTAS